MPSTIDKETPQQALARIQNSGMCDNDVIVVMHFYQAGIPAEEITPRENVLTFNAWKAKGRQVAKGATGCSFTTWIPCKQTKKQRESGDDSPKLRPKTTRVFHISQTIAADDPKGTRPVAWNNPVLVKAGTYEPDSPVSRHPVDKPHEETQPSPEIDSKPSEADQASDVAEKPERERHAEPVIVREEILDLDESGDLVLEDSADCTCPMAGLVTNVDCPLHGARVLA